jgi:outer membrane lipoprotein SlyB
VGSATTIKLSLRVHCQEISMSLKIRALIPVLALSGVLLTLSPVALADPPHRATNHAYEHGNYGHGNYGPQRDYRDRRAPRVYYYERHNDYGRYSNDYRYGYRNYPYQSYRSYGGYGDYGGYRGYGSYGGYRDGGCNTNGALTVLGAVTGGIIGNRSGSYRNRDVNTVVGALAGGVLGNVIGSAIDGDRGCRGY